jgi:hypothetical protein
MSDTKEIIDAIRKNSVFAELEKRFTVDANEELVNNYNSYAKPSYTHTEKQDQIINGKTKAVSVVSINEDDKNRAWQSDFLTPTRVTASCFLNPFASTDESDSKSESGSTIIDNTDDEVVTPKPLALAFASFNEFTDDVKALILKPTVLTLTGLWHAARFAFKLFELLAHLVVTALDWINLEIQKKKPVTDENTAVVQSSTHHLEQDLKNVGDAAFDLVESALKMLVYPFVAGYELPAQGLSIIARSIFSYRGTSRDDVAQVIHHGVDQVKEVAEHIASEDTDRLTSLT